MREVLLALLTPPFGLMILAAWISLALARGRGRWGLAAFWIGVAVLCTPIVAEAVLRIPLRVQPHLDLQTPPAPPFAVVVPTGGVTTLSGGLLWPSEDSALRAQHGRVLAEQLNAILVLSGGKPGGLLESEARVTARALGLTGDQVLLEEDSNDTCENAERTAALLRPRGITRVIAVSGAAHLPRVMACLRHHGLETIAAPFADQKEDEDPTPLDFLPGEPGARALGGAFRSYVGLVWYLATGRFSLGDLWPEAP